MCSWDAARQLAACLVLFCYFWSCVFGTTCPDSTAKTEWKTNYLVSQITSEYEKETLKGFFLLEERKEAQGFKSVLCQQGQQMHKDNTCPVVMPVRGWMCKSHWLVSGPTWIVDRDGSTQLRSWVASQEESFAWSSQAGNWGWRGLQSLPEDGISTRRGDCWALCLLWEVTALSQEEQKLDMQGRAEAGHGRDGSAPFTPSGSFLLALHCCPVTHFDGATVFQMIGNDCGFVLHQI